MRKEKSKPEVVDAAPDMAFRATPGVSRTVSRAGVWFRRYAILSHRWMGVVLCLLFATWFGSGIVLMYWEYPTVRERDRLARAAPLNAARIRLSPQDAYARLNAGEAPSGCSLVMFDGRPAYRFRFGRDSLLVYADTGELQENFPGDLTLRVAAAWTGLPAGMARFEGAMTREDQWTVSGEFRALRPLMKYEWPDGQEVYVSQVSGEVAQYTTRSSRLGAWFGAIPHWLYFTPLRRNGATWNRVVVWASGMGTVTAMFGLVVGLALYSPAEKRYRFPSGRSSIPYSGQKRWHTILGLLFGLVSCTWVFSGMLSMDPFGWDDGASEGRLAKALRGPLELEKFALRSPQEVLAERGGKVRELELAMFGGQAVYLARSAGGKTVIVPVDGAPAPVFDAARIAKIAADAAKPYGVAEARVVTQYEAYYVDRHRDKPLPVMAIRLNDAEQSLYYVDLKTARIVQSYAGPSRWNRWLYHGLHSFDLPWLYRHRPAWDIAVVTMMLGGTALSVT
ncbi:MAG: PepSY domain-containing protein, partial [Acidobacteriia bacterium]|nr:PepSY domain-containing protein [Terriglobia bacterium]